MYDLVSSITGTKNLLVNIATVTIVTVIAISILAILCNLGAYATASFGLIG
jgi:hypothetical protein